MTIVALDKVTLFGPAAQREQVLDALQRLGCMHLLDLNGSDGRSPLGESKSTDAHEALKYLSTSPVARRSSMQGKQYDTSKVVTQSLDIKRRQQALSDEHDQLVKAIEDLTPWGEFRIPVHQGLEQARLWFIKVQRCDEKSIARLDVPYEIVFEEPTCLYLVAISESQPAATAGQFVDLEPRPLSELIERRAWIEDSLEDLHWQRVELTRWIPWLQRSLDEADDRAARDWAQRLTWTDSELFAVQGWAPSDSRQEIAQTAKRLGLAVTFSQPTADDQPPTLLRNPDRVAGAEGAVTFYITPGYRAWDPTPVMFVSFSLFFGMIVADAGYGLLMAVGLLLFWRQLGKTRNGAHFRSLLTAIVGVTIVFGALAGSYFGLTPGAGSMLGRLRVLDFENRGQMMALSIFIGVAHLSLANVISAWNARRSWRAIGSLGWVMLMFGALMLAGGLLGPVPSTLMATVGKWVLLLGAMAILLFSSDRPLTSTRPSDWLARVFDGLTALTGVSKLFGDVLSYLRLFALGLASAQLAVTFNGLASDMSERGGIGLLLAAVILIAGHGINLVLGLMGGVVHGLRLNCIEFFNWSLTEEGTPFRSYHKKVTA